MTQYLPYLSDAEVQRRSEAQAAEIQARIAGPLARLQAAADAPREEHERLYLEAIAAVLGVKVGKGG